MSDEQTFDISPHEHPCQNVVGKEMTDINNLKSRRGSLVYELVDYGNLRGGVRIGRRLFSFQSGIVFLHIDDQKLGAALRMSLR